ncbi:hypothetical protein ACH4TX_32180 [Streptomyces sp. NPDC021098]|uniref:hypothetical protein n=1 Tax=unclassified Streptomyces TaxID=2593676 RepID=UPI0037ADA750
MTHFDSDAALDALLQTADDAVLTAVNDGLDLDAGRAALFTLVTTPERGDRQPPSWTISPDGTVTDFAGIPVEDTCQYEVRLEGPATRVVRWPGTVETNDLVNRILDLLDQISHDLDGLRRWLNCLSEDEPLVPGRVENAATWLAALVMGVQERNMSEETAVSSIHMVRHELREMQRRLSPFFRNGARTDVQVTQGRLNRLTDLLTAAKSLVQMLFADEGDHSYVLPVPTG